MDRLIAAPQRTVAVVQEVERFCDEHGYGPSVDELARAVGLSSASTTLHHIRRAVKLGLLTQHSDRHARTLRPVRPRCSHGRP